MAGKKQRRMEQDPNANERGKPPKPKPGVTVNVDGIDTGQFYDAFKVDAEKVEEIRAQVQADAERMAKQWMFGEGKDKTHPGAGGLLAAAPRQAAALRAAVSSSTG